MKKLAATLLVALSIFGCAQRQKYVEGTHLALGAYLPFEDAIYGVELLQFTSGAYLATSTNNHFKFERQCAYTNSYFWGMVQTREWSSTKLESPKDR